MKHYFIENPNSGKNNKIDVIQELVIPAAKKTGIDYEIYHTTGPGDATRFCKEKAEEAKQAGEKVRFYAVGGDGTLYEVVNGVYGYDNVEITVVPKGSGNDYIRLYGTVDEFRNVENLINGIPLQVDALKVTDQDGKEEIAINQASMGLDAEACSVQGEMKKIPGAFGHMTYTLGGLYCMFTKVLNRFKVTIDGKEIPGPFIQATAFVGQYYGSGIHGGPFGNPTDGKLDFSIIQRVMSWPVMFYFMMFHWNNTYDYYLKPYVDIIRGDKMTIESKKPAAVNVDGECRPVTKATFETLPKEFTFILPKDTNWFERVETHAIDFTINQGLDNREPRKTHLRYRHIFEHIVNRGIFGYRR